MIEKLKSFLTREVPAPDPKPEQKTEYIFIHDDRDNLLLLLDHFIKTMDGPAANLDTYCVVQEMKTVRKVVKATDRENINRMLEKLFEEEKEEE